MHPLVIPKASIGGAFLGEFLLGTAAGVAAGASNHLANVCAACGAGWQPGTDSEQALRAAALLELLGQDFNPRALVRECTHCLSEIPVPAKACAHCGVGYTDDEVAAAIEASRTWFDAQRTALIPPAPEPEPVVSHCFVCRAPLTERTQRTFKNRPFCDYHFTKAIE